MAALADEETKRGALNELLKRGPEAVKSAGHRTLWGVDLTDANEDEAIRVVVAKFVRARDGDVEEAFKMLVNCLSWRKAYGVDAPEFSQLDFGEAFLGHDDLLPGRDFQGRPMLLSRFGTMSPDTVFADTDTFLKWRVQMMECLVKRLAPWKVEQPETLLQIHDYADCAVVGRDERITAAVKVFSKTMADNYPELKGKTVFINFPTIFGILFNVVKIFIPAKTLEKFVMHGTC